MAWTTEVAEAAAEDALIIRDWYESQQSGLGTKFISAIESAKTKLLFNPLSFGIWKKDIRRIVITPFAYKIYYKVYKDKIIVFLIAHERRSNQFLKRRVQNLK